VKVNKPFYSDVIPSSTSFLYVFQYIKIPQAISFNFRILISKKKKNYKRVFNNVHDKEAKRYS
jgi:hypothetical protein